MYMYPTYYYEDQVFLERQVSWSTGHSRSTWTIAVFSSTNSPTTSVYPSTTIGFNICCRFRGHFVLSVPEYFYLAKQWCEILVLPDFRRSAFCCRL